MKMCYWSFRDSTLSMIVLIAGILAEATTEHPRRTIDYRKEELNFVVLGDWGGSEHAADDYQTEAQKECAALLNGKFSEDRKPNFFVSTGDNIYPLGVDSVDSPRFHQTFDNVFKYGKNESISWYMVAGNHDWHGNITAQVEYSKVNPRWVFPDLFYSIEYKGPLSLKLIFIDTMVLAGNNLHRPDRSKTVDANGNYIPNMPPGPADVGLAEGEWKWIEAELKKAKEENIKYTFIVGHYPIFSFNRFGISEHLTGLQGLMEKYGATGFMCGHEHNLQYTTVNNVHHILSGGGYKWRTEHTTTETENSKEWNFQEIFHYPPKDKQAGDKKQKVPLGGLAHIVLGKDNGTVTFYTCDGMELINFKFFPRL